MFYNQVDSLGRSFWLQHGSLEDKNGEQSDHFGDIAKVRDDNEGPKEGSTGEVEATIG